jgi:MSHA biogenesis protein MshP
MKCDQRLTVSYQQGFGAIAAIVILVILAVLAAAIVSVGTTQQLTSAQDVMSAKAWQAARAGDEWGLFKARNGQDWTVASTSCDTATRTATLNLQADTGFNVTVTCESWPYNEGESSPGVPATVRIYRITAVACPAATCPATDASVTGVGYVERTRVVMATN